LTGGTIYLVAEESAQIGGARKDHFPADRVKTTDCETHGNDSQRDWGDRIHPAGYRERHGNDAEGHNPGRDDSAGNEP
ncbi:MAG: hypothetical protein JWQ44_1178, partial [Chthoniobacter sp.]|nr:hypothetical protein [Chthoniobacter sp.]